MLFCTRTTERSPHCAKTSRNQCKASCYALGLGLRFPLPGFTHPRACAHSQPWTLRWARALCRRCRQAYRRSEAQSFRGPKQARGKRQSLHGISFLPLCLSTAGLAETTKISHRRPPRSPTGRVAAPSLRRRVLASRWRRIRSSSTLLFLHRSQRRTATDRCSPSLRQFVPMRAMCRRHRQRYLPPLPSQRKTPMLLQQLTRLPKPGLKALHVNALGGL